jgi:hypothetical protein
MPETKSEAEGVEWLIAPEISFARSAEDMAQMTAIKSDVFLETKAETKAALDKAFKDAENIFVQCLPRLTDIAVSKDQFTNSLPRELESLGELHGHQGLLASRDDKVRRKAAINAAFGARRALVSLKRIHQSTFDAVIGQIETARQNASIGIPRLPNDTRNKLEYLDGLERAQLSEAVSENMNHIAQIEAFHEAVRTRFGVALKIFGQTQTALTEEQRVHFEVLKTHEQDIRKAQRLVRSIALLGGDDEPLELDLDLEQDWNHGR